jgi:ABC-type histidine transport system ATPase subunit
LELYKIAIRTALAHRSAYWAGIVAQWLSYGSTFATLYIMVSNFEILGDWNPDEMIFMYALNLLAYAIAATFFFNPCTRLSAKIRTGEFDHGLTKPLSPFGHELYMGFNFGYVSHISLSIAVMIFACFQVQLSLSLSMIITFLRMLLGAALVNAAMLIAVSGTSFFMVNDNLALAMLHDPDVLYLDEPTIGLDVMSKKILRQSILALDREKNTTIILTTHDMNDIEAVCKRLMLIDKGRKLFDGSLTDFKERYEDGFMVKLEFTELPHWSAEQ